MKKLKGEEREIEIERLQQILKDLFPDMKADTATEWQRRTWRNTLQLLEEI